MSTNEQPGNRSGGGIVFGGGARAPRPDPATAAELMSGLRRRWPSGIAVVTAVDGTSGYRGVTVSSLMVVSQEPPILALALAESGSFQRLAEPGAALGISILDAAHDFPAERFAGRAPLPDAQFTGIAHRLVAGVPVLEGALGWAVGSVWQRQEFGDHMLVLLEVAQGGLGEDTDDPLLAYEGRTRRLEAG